MSDAQGPNAVDIEADLVGGSTYGWSRETSSGEVYGCLAEDILAVLNWQYSQKLLRSSQRREEDNRGQN